METGKQNAATAQRRLKCGYFILEGLNSFAFTLFFYYFYFFMQQQFGFGNKVNLMLAAASGLIYVPAAIVGGRFAQRAGYFTALKLGFAILIASLAAGWLLMHSVAGCTIAMLMATVGICFAWPPLEAMVSEGETYAGLQKNVGIYNVVWAGTSALAYFTGGAMLEKLGLHSLFLVPLIFFVVQLALTVYLEHAAESAPRIEPVKEAPHPHSAAKTRSFLRMAWLSNPCAYIAINTLIAVMPTVAKRLELSTTLAGFSCSVWCFARLAAFFGFWFWTGWHYRFRWLLGAFLTLVASFTAAVLAPDLAVLVAAQLFFGVAIGLIYYSSLFYSMDVGETKGEHGGIHEAAIGLGNFAGPAIGAITLQVLPGFANGGVLAVSGLLSLGLLALVSIQLRGCKPDVAQAS
ncbi:MAG TPA: MFS transporter [Verrucomicrobiae bacterium]|nr:MFS transporter [Verrucomicrobiae bacterium]